MKDFGRINVKGSIKTYHADTNQKIAGEVIGISEADFRTRKVIRHEQCSALNNNKGQFFKKT